MAYSAFLLVQHADFLLVQHAGDRPDFQARCLPMLLEAALRGEVPRSAVAYLTDRVRVKERQPQLYGTQYSVQSNGSGAAVADESGRFAYLLPIVEDVDALDALDDLCAAMGLDPWVDDEASMAPQQHRDPAKRPRQWSGVENYPAVSSG